MSIYRVFYQAQLCMAILKVQSLMVDHVVRRSLFQQGHVLCQPLSTPLLTVNLLTNLPLHHKKYKTGDLCSCPRFTSIAKPKMLAEWLKTLGAQGLNLVDTRPAQATAQEQALPHAWRLPSLPDLSGLQNLQALNLAENNLRRMPPVLSKLTKLRFLDLSVNKNLKVACRTSFFACACEEDPMLWPF